MELILLPILLVAAIAYVGVVIAGLPAVALVYGLHALGLGWGWSIALGVCAFCSLLSWWDDRSKVRGETR